MAVFQRDPLPAAIRSLQAELDGGPRAELPALMEVLGALLLEREARLRARERDEPERELLAAVPDAAAVVGRDGRVRVSNTAFDGLAPGGRAAGLTVLEATRSAELSEAIRRALEGTARRLDLALGRQALLGLVTPLLRGEVLLVLRDVTEARRLEATRKNFVANASHELRTPVSSIVGAAETLLGGALADPDRTREFVEIIHRQAERLRSLVADLLDLSRIESGHWPIEVGPVELEPLCRRSLEAVADLARRRRIALACEVAPGLSARADARALEQVLVNLLDNAVKYTPEGGRAAVAAAPEGDRVVVSVADTGPGIERHHLPRLFER
ncbi:MAG TPA: histidine kinase dimerization/phospho-acceptor domain-containing protein, partial [Anaeromyxobacteraceae bacterium]|nr:histidine kinase dimerization/phospho-acceptor domain-containing protein [Anaeromyxobacteraceae bacterium]